MALRPLDRYATPRHLGENLRKWLADEPVSAQVEPLLDRLRRRAKKHRTLVAVSLAVLVVSATALTAISFIQTRRTTGWNAKASACASPMCNSVKHRRQARGQEAGDRAVQFHARRDQDVSYRRL